MLSCKWRKPCVWQTAVKTMKSAGIPKCAVTILHLELAQHSSKTSTAGHQKITHLLEYVQMD